MTLTLRLRLTPDEVLKYYRGDARQVRAVSVDGRTVSFPATVIRRHVTPVGVFGTFRLVTDELHRLVAFDRVA